MRNAECLRDFIDRNDSRIAPPAFDTADILLRKPRAFCQFLLSHARSDSSAFHIAANELAHVHAASIDGHPSRGLPTIVCGLGVARVHFPGGDSTTSPNIYECLLRCRAASEAAPDPRLEAEVLHFSGLSPAMAAAFAKRPLVLFRAVATPNREMTRFLQLARISGRPALVATIPQDRFTPTVNFTKRRLAKLPVATRAGRIRYVNVSWFETMDGLRFSGMNCRDGTRFLDFHDELMRIAIAPQLVPVTLDMSSFLGDGGAREYYARFLALFTCFGVLAESCADYGYERSFTEDVILPAIAEVTARFGKTPRILRLLPPGEELEAEWEHYPNSVLERALLAARLPAPRGTP